MYNLIILDVDKYSKTSYCFNNFFVYLNIQYRSRVLGCITKTFLNSNIKLKKHTVVKEKNRMNLMLKHKLCNPVFRDFSETRKV